MINNYCSRKNKEQFQELCGITATSSKWMLHHSVFTNSFVESNDRLTAASFNKLISILTSILALLYNHQIIYTTPSIN